jgi:hypothetical protein
MVKCLAIFCLFCGTPVLNKYPMKEEEVMKGRLWRGSRLLSMAVVLSLPVTSFALTNDSVLSPYIKRADGTSGQDVSIGSGVKTDHIQNGAVTTSKIADGAVGTGNIANGAVTDDKIAGPISPSKIGEGVFQKKYAQVVTVAKTGGDFSDPVSAINSITDASAANPYLVKVMPGVYDIGTSPLRLISYVDLQGSGENNTNIVGTVDWWVSYGGVINAAANTEIRSLTVTSNPNNIPGTYIALVYVSQNAQSPLTLSNVTVVANGSYAIGMNVGTVCGTLADKVILNHVKVTANASTSCNGVATGIGGENQIEVNDSTITCNGPDGLGLDFGRGKFKVTNSEVTASRAYGIRTADAKIKGTIVNAAKMGLMTGIGVVEINDSELVSDGLPGSYSILTGGTSKVYVSNTKIVGPIRNDASMKCLNSFNATYDAVSCP